MGRMVDLDIVYIHLSPISVDRFPEVDDEGDVDVEQCSDSETTPSSRHGSSSRKSHHSSRATPGTPSDEERLTPEPATTKNTIKGSCNSDDLRPVQCHLETKELWDKFHDLGTEMIITKTGRTSLMSLGVCVYGDEELTRQKSWVLLFLRLYGHCRRREANLLINPKARAAVASDTSHDTLTISGRDQTIPCQKCDPSGQGSDRHTPGGMLLMMPSIKGEAAPGPVLLMGDDEHFVRRVN
ncbi:conserved hypothetical protein [Culex quinquefasciatus]|uniref:T-box domain-containing protein n=1 Tax=Culex quinquefasciatus TaxID=7176 RepID=B0W067_CULQU|nr:conserved hypothetical protein [Culex quinquefasciatus]|eukprot:XP_001842101.1 conserved hypothetical protein [Culex quinquefasciatus]